MSVLIPNEGERTLRFTFKNSMLFLSMEQASLHKDLLSRDQHIHKSVMSVKVTLILLVSFSQSVPGSRIYMLHAVS